MALIVEDGTGRADAESYATWAQVVAYYGARGKSDINSVDVQLGEAFLRLATEYMTGYYRSQWKGYRASPLQALDWPRNAVTIDDVSGGFRSEYGGNWPYTFPNNTVPQDVITACIIMAYKASQADDNDLWPDLEQATIIEKIDVITTTFDPSSPLYTLYRSVDLKLQAYLKNSSGAGVDLVRC